LGLILVRVPGGIVKVVEAESMDKESLFAMIESDYAYIIFR
jgi:hypothetical protein